MRGYRWYKHHAWAGLALITILFSLRYLFDIPYPIFVVILSILIIYVLISLIGTYLYSREILSGEKQTIEQKNLDEKINKKLEKERLKLEKKRAKLEYKLNKKQKKIK